MQYANYICEGQTLVLPCSVLSTIYYQLLLFGIVVDDNFCWWINKWNEMKWMRMLNRFTTFPDSIWTWWLLIFDTIQWNHQLIIIFWRMITAVHLLNDPDCCQRPWRTNHGCFPDQLHRLWPGWSSLPCSTDQHLHLHEWTVHLRASHFWNKVGKLASTTEHHSIVSYWI